jgi:hypothetical protein
LYEIVEGISQDSMTKAEKLQAQTESDALLKLDQIDKLERKTKFKNKLEEEKVKAMNASL